VASISTSDLSVSSLLASENGTMLFGRLALSSGRLLRSNKVPSLP
jgi:hypothetical protein